MKKFFAVALLVLAVSASYAATQVQDAGTMNRSCRECTR